MPSSDVILVSAKQYSGSDVMAVLLYPRLSMPDCWKHPIPIEENPVVSQSVVFRAEQPIKA